MMGDTLNGGPVPTLAGERVTLRAVQAEDEQARLSLGWHTAIERNYGRPARLRATRYLAPSGASS